MTLCEVFPQKLYPKYFTLIPLEEYFGSQWNIGSEVVRIPPAVPKINANEKGQYPVNHWLSTAACCVRRINEQGFCPMKFILSRPL